MIRVNRREFPAEVREKGLDRMWGGRSVKEITMTVDMATAEQLFPSAGRVGWSTITTRDLHIPRENEDGTPAYDEAGNPVIDLVEEEVEEDQSLWCVCGAIINNRDGTLTVKMGKELDSELKAERDEYSAQLAVLMEGE